MTLILTRRDIADVLSLDACIDAVERAFALHAQGRALPPAMLGVHAAAGSFHVKAAGLQLSRAYFAAKTNANFPGNPDRFGLPTIQGVLVLCDAERGTPLAVMDSTEITALRTAAASAVAVRHLARAGCRVAAICGCGTQGRVHARALARVLPIDRFVAFDADAARARLFANEMSARLSCRVDVAPTAADALGQGEVIVTCTTASRAFVYRSDVRPGTFIAAVGADNEHKQEIDPDLMGASAVVVDVLDQAAVIGDLHHALAAGAMTRDAVRATLGEVVVGERRGRLSDDEIVIFDSTGFAIQDVAAAALAYEAAESRGIGTRISLGGGSRSGPPVHLRFFM